MSEALLTIAEAGERLRQSRDSIYKLMQSGQLPSLKIGRSRRIPESAVEAFIAERLDSTGTVA